MMRILPDMVGLPSMALSAGVFVTCVILIIIALLCIESRIRNHKEKNDQR